MIAKECLECGPEFIPKNYKAKFCGNPCANKNWKRKNAKKAEYIRKFKPIPQAQKWK